MMQSENIIEITGALIKLQSKLDFASKDSSNPFFKSKYADLATVWATCKDLLTENNLAVVQQMDIVESKNVLVTTLFHSSGQWFKSIAPLNPVKNDPQAYGSAITYMRRYSLCAMLGIIQDDDDAEKCMDRKKSKYESKKFQDNACEQEQFVDPAELHEKREKMKAAFINYAQFYEESDQELIVEYLSAYSKLRNKNHEETLERFKDDQEFLKLFNFWKNKRLQ